jgi:hypothetical protein
MMPKVQRLSRRSQRVVRTELVRERNYYSQEIHFTSPEKFANVHAQAAPIPVRLSLGMRKTDHRGARATGEIMKVFPRALAVSLPFWLISTATTQVQPGM